MNFEALRVGELAGRTGLTVRTLHHYDEIGLLKPSQHSAAGYRLYTTADIARLHHVLSLRRLGFALEEIRDCLDRPDFEPLEVIRLHVARLREQIEVQGKLRERLEALAEQLRKAEEVSADEFLSMIEAMTMFEKYYTPEQLKFFEDRRQAGGAEMEEATQKGPQMWADLFADVDAALAAGVPSEDPKARDLAARWLALVTMVTGGDPGIFNAMRRMYENEDNVMGTDTKALKPRMDYIMKAANAAGIKHPA